MPDAYASMADYYDLLLPNSARDSNGCAGWLAELLRPLGVASVLDCTCGTGMQAVALARLGYTVTASDISNRMLAVARKRARQAEARVRVIRADVRSLEAAFAQPFDMVFTSGSALAHLTAPGDLRRAIQSIAAVTKSGAYCLLALADHVLPEPSIFKRIELPDGKAVSLLATTVRQDDKLTVRLFLTRDGDGGPRVSTRVMRLRIPAKAELVALLDEAGFDVDDLSQANTTVILLGRKLRARP